MRRISSTALCVLMLAPLAACVSDRPEWLGGEPKRPAEDFRPGPRRAPALQNVPPAGNVQMPRDYYGEAQMQMPPPPPPPPPAMAMTQQPQPVRKPFPGDPRYSMETAGVAPIPPAPEVMPPPEVKAVSANVPPSLSPRPAEVAAPPPTAAEMKKNSEALAKETTEEMKDVPYPKLSDVPERPAEFDKIKTEQANKLDELTHEHDMAQEQRDKLAQEPSQVETKVKTAAQKTAEAITEESSSIPVASKQSVTTFPPGKYEEQLEQEQALY